jgi:two-component system, chemotaxis family, protein-glutamate methylesterase/glutaminase
MPEHDIIVVGASAGGVEALQSLVQGLPRDLRAAVFVVLHIPADAPSHLPAILTKRGRLKAMHPLDGQPIENGCIYVAPPDYHLIVDPDKIRVVKGPKENRHRPSVDVLFRSAAISYGPRVIGVVMSGTMDDGVVGMKEIKNCGGMAVVQDPEDALYPEMPTYCIENVEVDYRGTAAQLGGLLARLAKESAPEGGFKVPDRVNMEANLAKNEASPADTVPKLGEPSAYTCPECHGTLFEIQNGEILRFRCRVGHAYTAESLIADHNESVEIAMWVALRTLEESAALSEQMAQRALEEGHDIVYSVFKERAAERSRQADLIRRILITDEQPGGGEEAS